jgi:ABC-type glycerol-3-phosphate transport system substrate-binding protein
MRTVSCIVAALTVFGMAGCADQFRAQQPRPLIEHQERAPRGSTHLTMVRLPPDVAWMGDAVRLFEATHGGATVQFIDGGSAAGTGVTPPRTASVLTPEVTSPSGVGNRLTAANEADLQLVALPLTREQGSALAPVPAEVEAAVSPALLPAAMQSAQHDGRTLALPVTHRWMALAWNPSRLPDRAAPVPPHLEAWLDQLRALRQRQPSQPPVLVAWAEREIYGSFALLLAAHGGRLLDETGQPAFVSDEGEAAVGLMIRMLEERLVQPTALETSTQRLAASLTGPYTYWLCPSDALTLVDSGRDRLAALRLSGLPMASARYRYPDSTAVALVQFRGVAVARDSSQAAAAWRLARFIADPVVLRSSPAVATVLASPPPTDSALVRQARALVTQPGAEPWPAPPGLNESLGRFLHAALRRILTPREALERAALQFRQPGALPESRSETDEATRGGSGYPSGYPGPEGTSGTPAETGGADTGSVSTPSSGTPQVGPPAARQSPPSDGLSGTPGGAPAPYRSGDQGSNTGQGLRAAPEPR